MVCPFQFSRQVWLSEIHFSTRNQKCELYFHVSYRIKTKQILWMGKKIRVSHFITTLQSPVPPFYSKKHCMCAKLTGKALTFALGTCNLDLWRYKGRMKKIQGKAEVKTCRQGRVTHMQENPALFFFWSTASRKKQKLGCWEVWILTTEGCF